MKNNNLMDVVNKRIECTNKCANNVGVQIYILHLVFALQTIACSANALEGWFSKT